MQLILSHVCSCNQLVIHILVTPIKFIGSLRWALVVSLCWSAIVFPIENEETLVLVFPGIVGHIWRKAKRVQGCCCHMSVTCLYSTPLCTVVYTTVICDAFVTKRWPSLPWTSFLAIQRRKVIHLLLNKFFMCTGERVQGHSGGSEETEP